MTVDLPLLAKEASTITNGAASIIEAGFPYRLEVSIVGTAPMLLHKWNVDAVAEKSAAAKGSQAKKTDDVPSYVYWTPSGHIGVPGQNFASCLVNSGRYMQDPRSPRRSAMELCRAGVVPLTLVAPFEPETKAWDYEFAARVTVQRAGVTRIRPAMREGWRLTFSLLVTTPEYLTMPIMAHLIGQAGRLVGLCDHRPTYGRFAVASMHCYAP